MLSLNYEYRVIPAPRRAVKAKAISKSDERFALSLSMLMNEMGREGWEYVRADTLPMDERSGLAGTKTSYMNMLVFRRVIVRHSQMLDAAEDQDMQPAVLQFNMSALQAAE
jgi:hypothetical protein